MPIVYDDQPGAGAQPEPKPSKPTPPMRPSPPFGHTQRREDMTSEQLANRALAAATRAAEVFKELGPAAIEQAPDTFASLVTSENPAVAYVANDVLMFAAQELGIEGLGPQVATYLLDFDPAVAANTRAVLASVESQLRLSGGVLYADQSQAAPIDQDEVKVAMLQAASQGQDAFRAYVGGLTGPEQAMVGTFASELLQSLQQLPDAGVAGELKRAVAVATSGDYAEALGQDTLDTIRSGVEAYGLGDLSVASKLGRSITLGPDGKPVISEAQSIPGGNTLDTPELGDVGIQQVRQMGNAGEVVLNQEWAEANLADAYATKGYLEQIFPGIKVSVGAQGALGFFVDKITQPIDYLASVPGAALNQVSEFAEKIRYSDEERAEMLARADRYERNLTDPLVKNTLSPDEISANVRAIGHLREEATPEFLSPERIFTDMLDATNPEETGMGFGDSFTKAMNLLPGDPGYGYAHAISSLVFAVAADPLNWLLPALAGRRAAKYIPKVEFSKWLDEVGGTKGLAKTLFDEGSFYERAFEEVVDNAARSGTKVGLEEARRSAGQIARNRAEEAAEAMIAEHRATGYVHAPVGTSATKTYFYRALAPTVEEWSTSKPMIRAGKRLWEARSRRGPEAFAAALQRKGVSGDVARYLSRASNPGEMQMAITRASMGLHYTPTNLGELEHRLSQIRREIEGLTQPPPGQVVERTRHASGRGHVPGEIEDLANADTHVPLLSHMTEEHQLANERAIELSLAGGTDEGWDLAREHQSLHSGREITPARAYSLDRGLNPVNTERGRQLLTEKYFLQDTIQGADWVQPMTNFVTPRWIRSFERTVGAPRTPIHAAYNAASDLVQEFPGNLLSAVIGPTGKGRLLTGPATSDRYFISMRNMYRDTGAGQIITLPTTTRGSRVFRSLDEETRLLSQERSYQAIFNMGESMGIPTARMLELMAPWSRGELRHFTDSYNWLTSTWETMVEESPFIPVWAKQDMARMWKEQFVEERAVGKVYRGGENSVSTLTKWDDAAQRPKPVPVFEGDMLQGWRLPDLGQMRSFMTHTQQIAKYGDKVAKGAIHHFSRAYLGATQAFSIATSWWKNIVLGVRLFGALPARIVSEELLRMAAFDYASAVHHPMEWFHTTSLGARADDVTTLLFSDVPIENLGAAVVQMETRMPWYRARTGRATVTTLDGPIFYKAQSARQAVYRKSHSAKVLARSEDAAAAIRALNETKAGRAMVEYWNGLDMLVDGRRLSLEEKVQRAMDEIEQIAGTGEAAEAVADATRTGVLSIDDTVYRVGTQEYAKKLEELASDGRWVPNPTTEIPISAADYLPLEKSNVAREFTDKMFRWFYTNPDLAMARSPLYRQMATRRFEELLARGYSPDRARSIAQANAAEGTANIMFTIGQKTSGEYALRNLMPFFPAYRELAATWLLRAPMRIGEGMGGAGAAWIAGASALARRADYWLQFFKEMGVLRLDGEGNWTVPMPFMAAPLAAMTGVQAKFITSTPIESFAGVFPLPASLFATDDEGKPLPLSKRLSGVLPSLGSIPTVALGFFNDQLDGMLEPIEEWLTPFGADQAIEPPLIDRVLQLFGQDSVLSTATTRDFQSALNTFAVIDGMRLAENAMAAEGKTRPTVEGVNTPEEKQDKAEEIRAYVDELVERGNAYAHGVSIYKMVASMFLPFSPRISDEERSRLSAFWSFLNVLPEEIGGGPLRSAAMDALTATWPKVGPYMTGKTQDLRTVDDPDEDIDAYFDAIKTGEVVVRTPEERAVLSLVLGSYRIYRSRIDAIHAETPGSDDWLRNFDSREEIDQLTADWLNYLEYMDSETMRREFDGISGKNLYENYITFIQARAGDRPPLSMEQERLLDFNRSLKEYADYFSTDPKNGQKYYKMRDAAFAALGRMSVSSPHSEAQSWWYSDIADPYYDQRNDLFEKLNELPQAPTMSRPYTEAEREELRADIRDLANRYYKPLANPANPQWGDDFPSPEEMVFLRLNKPAQRREIAAWAALKPEWLTQFQREQVGYDVPRGKQDEANKLSGFISKQEAAWERWLIDNANPGTFILSEQSLAAQDQRAKVDKAITEKAKDLGLEDYWESVQRPAYKRIGEALNLDDRTALWTKFVADADDLRRQLAQRDVSAGGTTWDASWAHDWMIRKTAKLRDKTLPTYNAAFDRVMTELSEALAEDGQPLVHEDLVRVLFFDKYFI